LVFSFLPIQYTTAQDEPDNPDVATCSSDSDVSPYATMTYVNIKG
jgi:hypothetical protein